MSEQVSRDTVLVIDDEPSLRLLISEIGASCGLRMLEAPNCRVGIKMLQEELPRVKMILLDYFMPGMTPGECAKALIELIPSEVPIILVTASENPGVRASELKLEKWLSKPFTFRQMRNLLESGTL